MIAVDGMGGDHAPHAVVAGVLQAARSGISVALTGPVDVLSTTFSQLDSSWKSLPITLVDAPSIIAMGEEPSSGVRRKTDSSLVKAVSLVKEGVCSGVISAGNSGALMAAAVLVLGRSSGIQRPAIAGILPTRRGHAVVLDLGANVDCKAAYLRQFADMGTQYASRELGIEHPRVGLLSNGAEPGKGSKLVKEAAELLDGSEGFVGNVEPEAVLNGDADVVVCDGFTGNIFLKAVEAMVQFTTGLAGDVQGNISKPFKRVQASGAHLLGVNGEVVVLHGNASAAGVSAAIAALNQKNMHNSDAARSVAVSST